MSNDGLNENYRKWGFGTNPRDLKALDQFLNKGNYQGMGAENVPFDLVRQQGMKVRGGSGIEYDRKCQKIGEFYAFTYNVQKVQAHLNKAIHIGRVIQKNVDGTFDVEIKTSGTTLYGITTQFTGSDFRPNDFVMVVFFDGDKIKPVIAGGASFKVGGSFTTTYYNRDVV